MKYISLLIFAVALIWTWNIIHDSSSISFETHSGIQERMAEYLNNKIKEKKPTASEIKVEKIWTEVLGINKVRAFFIYSFSDMTESGPVKSEIKGEGILERQAEDDSGMDRWTLTKIHTTSDAIQFDEATLITGSAKSLPKEDSDSETKSEIKPETKDENHK